MIYHETPEALSKRKKIGWIASPIGLLFLIMAFSLENDPYFGSTFRLMGIGTGGLILTAGLHGILSNPVLWTGDNSIKISGWMLPQSNFDLNWGDITKASLTTSAPGTRTLFLWDKAGKPRVIEEQRFEGFEPVLEHVEKNLAYRQIVIEAFTPLAQKKNDK
jgi:hypothetical protein